MAMKRHDGPSLFTTTRLVNRLFMLAVIAVAVFSVDAVLTAVLPNVRNGGELINWLFSAAALAIICSPVVYLLVTYLNRRVDAESFEGQRMSGEFGQNALEEVPESVMVIDTDNKVLMINKAMRDLMQIEDSSMEGMSSRLLSPKCSRNSSVVRWLL